jgi:hypothetical protein
VRRVVVSLCLSAALLAGCDSSDVPPTCDEAGLETLVIMAQSVTGAELIPCLESLPVGWTLSSIEVKDTGTHLTFDLDRGGMGAVEVIFTSRCDISGADMLPSDEEPAELWEEPARIGARYTANRYYVFDGGCVTYDFDLPQDDTLLAQAFVALTFKPRDEIERAYDETTGIQG